jgi:hypothetical protein
MLSWTTWWVGSCCLRVGGGAVGGFRGVGGDKVGLRLGLEGLLEIRFGGNSCAKIGLRRLSWGLGAAATVGGMLG